MRGGHSNTPSASQIWIKITWKLKLVAGKHDLPYNNPGSLAPVPLGWGWGWGWGEFVWSGFYYQVHYFLLGRHFYLCSFTQHKILNIFVLTCFFNVLLLAISGILAKHRWPACVWWTLVSHQALLQTTIASQKSQTTTLWFKNLKRPSSLCTCTFRR